MNFFSLQRQVIEVDDKTPEDLTVIKIKNGGILQNKLGRFAHDEMIGIPFGSQIWSLDRKKQIHLLRPTPELWTRVLPHRTQIIYMPDIAFILEMLDIRPGSIIIESGTGSGSFSHSVARAIGPTGRLYTFDFHAERASKVTEEFAHHKLDDRVIAKCRDVCTYGFGLEGVADAVFLDLPSPWQVIGHARQALCQDRVTKIACFSPCIEQVQRTLSVLIDEGFCEMEMFEVGVHPLEVEERPTLSSKTETGPNYISKVKSTIKGHTSYLYFASLIPTCWTNK